MIYRIAICDDNMQDLETLRIGAEKWLEHKIEIKGSVTAFRSPKKLQDCLEKERFDLYLLDIMMLDIDGIELGRLIRRSDADVPIIYVTLSSDYALDAYGIHAIRYLTKPFEMEELYSALEFSYELFRIRPRHTLLISGPEYVTSIIMEEIMYIENNLRNMTYTMNDGSTLVSVRRGGSFESAVEPIASDANFIQPHKSFFVNMRYIRVLQSDVVLMDDGREIPLARKRLNEIQDKYISFISKKGGKS